MRELEEARFNLPRNIEKEIKKRSRKGNKLEGIVTFVIVELFEIYAKEIRDDGLGSFLDRIAEFCESESV